MEENTTGAGVEGVRTQGGQVRDVGWNYGFRRDPNNYDRVQCNTCNKRMCGGVYRIKEHIAHIPGNVTPCPDSTEEDKRICRDAIIKGKEKKQKVKAEKLEVRQEVDINRNNDDDDCVSMGNKRKIGPMDINTQLNKNVKQPKIKDMLDKQRWQRVASINARWVYVSGVPFNSIHNDEFLQLMEAVGQYGPGYIPPTQYQLGGPLLKEQVENTKNSLKTHEKEWAINGCSILTDAWSDQKRRSIMNICINCKEGTTFVSSIEASGDAHTGEYIYNYVVKHIEEVGEEKVVQVVTDNASNNMSAAGLLKESKPNIFWTSCAAHTIDLMLEGIGELKKFKDVIEKAKSLVTFIYAHHSTLNLMRKKTKKKDIVRPGVTRFATAYLTLESLLKKKESLRSMFICDEWDASPLSRCAKGKTSSATVHSQNFWNTVILCMNVFGSLVEVLRIVDGDRRPSMAFLYGELKTAKEVIGKPVKEKNLLAQIMSIIETKSKNRLDGPLHLAAYYLNPFYYYKDKQGVRIYYYKDKQGVENELGVVNAVVECIEKFFPNDEDLQNKIANEEVLAYANARGSFGKSLAVKGCETNHENYDPVGWWSIHGSSAPNLKKMAKRILSLTSSSSGCERNWSTFEGIHTKKRNRLDVSKLHNLVYVQFNAKILNKKRRSKGKPIKFLHGEDASTAQGWLVDGGDNNVDPETGIPWSVIGEAMGADEALEPRKSTRNQSEMRELHEEDFESEAENVDEGENEEEIEFEDSGDD